MLSLSISLFSEGSTDIHPLSFLQEVSLDSMVRPFQNQFPIFLQETFGCAPRRELCQNPILYLDQVFDVYNFVLLEGTRQFFHHPTSNMLKLTKPSWIDKNRHELPVPVYLQTDFTPKRMVVSRLHDTVAKSPTGVKFSPRCENRGELTPRRLAPA